ncbi:MAG TPA: GGDEF domain-containing phosphodiesterase [Steroidobacteraceae bacterium]|nr:GGDEF domain-containing phosphodiesterase [Steroidobacteraceae bacterium]
MTTALQAPPQASGYADCLEAVRARLAAREAKLYGIAVLVVYVHQLERLFASAGHVNAGRMLDELRNRLSQVSKPGDYFARLGDRKFVFVLSNLRNEGHALLAANKILRTAAEPVSAGGQHATVRLSVGVSMHPAHGRTPEALMQCAEIALLEAWKTQIPTVVYTERKAEELVAGWDLETQLANALEHGDLVMNYQPKLSLPKLEVIGCEALMRWNRPDAGNVPPEIFIDVAEMTGQIDPLTRFAFHRALRQLGEWPKSVGAVGVAVNVTPSIICNPELVEAVRGAAELWSVQLERLTVEVTENALMVDRERSHRVLTELRELGARISIDDFGTGYSSLAYLKQVPADELKIDKSFVMNMLADEADARIVAQVVALGHSFGLEVVAEGVESAEVAAKLAAMGCDYAQGFHYAKPLPPQEFPGWVNAWRRR